MKIIIPMAGMGTRMRPQTLTTPKPLLPISGKSIVQRLIEELVKSIDVKISEIAYIIGDFGKEVENSLREIADSLGVKGSIYYQQEPLGTAHAIYCAEKSLNESCIVAFADTLFKADFRLNLNADGIIWVNKVDKPEDFGVVKFNEEGIISDFIEKPKKFVSDLAIIGIYYFKDGNNLRSELKYLIDNKIKVGKEYQLTTALENMKNKGLKFQVGEVAKWMDCGNKMSTLNTNKEILCMMADWERREKGHIMKNVFVIEPCFIGENVEIYNSVIGPYVSLEKGVKIANSNIANSIIQENSKIKNVGFVNSFIGKNVELKEKLNEFNLGDFTKIENE